MLARGVCCSSHLLASARGASLPVPTSLRRRPSLHSSRACTCAAMEEPQQSTLSLDSKWDTHTLPSILTACAQSHLPQYVVQSIIEEHEKMLQHEKELQLEKREKELQLEKLQHEKELQLEKLQHEKELQLEKLQLEKEKHEKELQLKEDQLKITILEYLRAQGKLDARGLLEYAQRVLAISKETVTAQDGQQKWSGVFMDKPRLLSCIQKKLNMKTLGAGKAASMVLSAYSLVSGAIHSNKFIQTDTDAVVISEGILSRDQMLILECIAQEVEAPYKMVYTKDDTKSAF